MSKKFFGGNNTKTGSPAAAPRGPDAVGNLTQEACLRKSADYSFMLQDYEAAQNSYHTAKREFNTDKAWMALAGVQVQLTPTLPLTHQKVNLNNG